MFELANDIVARATRLLFADRDEPGLWTISAHGRVVGSPVCEAGARRLSWFDGAGQRLAAAPVRLEALAA